MYKYNHPKEVLITHGVVQSDLARCSIGKEQEFSKEITSKPTEEESLLDEREFKY